MFSNVSPERTGTQGTPVREVCGRCADILQEQEKCGKDAGKHHPIYRGRTIPKSEPSQDHSNPCQQNKVPGIRILQEQREVQIPGAPKERPKDERQDKGDNPEEQRVEQRLPAAETCGVCQRVDKLLQTCRHERTDDGDG